MPLDRFLIAPYSTGVQQNLKPWLIMDDAFQELRNCRTWRGRIRKRFGSYNMNMSVSDVDKQLFSRLRLKLGTTDPGTGNLAGTVPGAIYKIGQSFSVETNPRNLLTVYQANGALYSTGTTTGTYNTATGAYSITVAPAAAIDVYFYPSEPVMALPSYNGKNVNDEQLTGFDTQFAYKFAKSTGWQCLGPVPQNPPIGTEGLWTGSDSDFHNTCNWRGTSAGTYLLFVVNGVIADQIKYYDGVSDTWTSFQPIYNQGSGDRIRTAKWVIQFKNRLLLLNTTEQVGAGDILFQNRIRFSKEGDPIATDSWYDDANLLNGGFITVPTNQAIVGTGFLRDRLIVYLEDSTWELVYTNNDAYPFIVQQINTVLGVESGNSIVEFDKNILGFGSTGIHACSGTNVDRIDNKIPSTIFDIQNINAGPQRATGIRDYFTQEVYWSYPSSSNTGSFSQTFPNTVLVYSYETESFSANDDSITAFGYFQNNGSLTWADLTFSWQQATGVWYDPSLIALFRNVVAGNQQGWTFIVDSERAANAQSLSITDMDIFAVGFTNLYIRDHNLKLNDYIYINNAVGVNGINDEIYRVNSVINANTISIVTIGVTGTYAGGGTCSLVSNVKLVSKQYNFYNSVGKKANISRIDFLVTKTTNGKIFFDYNTSFSTVSLSNDSAMINSALGTNILDTNAQSTYEQTQDMLWRSLFPFAEGLVIQYQLYFNNSLMLDKDAVFSDFELHAILFYARPTSDLGF